MEKEVTVIVGSRTPSQYSGKVIEKLMPVLLKKKQVIASGLAKGVDALAHQNALNFGGKTIAVVANGLNYFYPREIRSCSSKLPPGVSCLANTCPTRRQDPSAFQSATGFWPGFART